MTWRTDCWKMAKIAFFLNKEQQWALQFFKFKIIYFLYPLSVWHILLLQTTLNVFQYFSRLHQGFTFRPITMRIFRYDESIRRSKSTWPFYETSSYVNRSWKPPSRRFEFFSWFLSTSMAATSDAEVSESGRQTK